MSARSTTTWRCLLFAMALACPVSMAWCLEPPNAVSIKDRPDDAGTGLIVTWTASVDDAGSPQPGKVQEYQVYRVVSGQRGDEPIGKVAAGVFSLVDDDTEPGIAYQYVVVAVDGEQRSNEATSETAIPQIEWFNGSRLWLAIIVAFVCGAVLVCTELARRGFSTYVRPLAGLAAIDEAVGRATEMGRPILFIPGIEDLNQIDTVAGLTILAHVGEKAAEYDMPIDVPTSRSLVMTAAKEALAGAYLQAGRPDAFDGNRIYYVTEEQFGYVAAVCGWISREKPAACFFLGKFFAESLVLAETGNSVGAIQLAGTAEPSQLPFFVAACDYTLLGEELFAASAYLSGEPQQLGTLKGQDLGKVFAAVILVSGCLIATWVELSGHHESAVAVFTYLKDSILAGGGG